MPVAEALAVDLRLNDLFVVEALSEDPEPSKSSNEIILVVIILQKVDF